MQSLKKIVALFFVCYCSLQEQDPDLQGPFDSRSDGSGLELDVADGDSAIEGEVENLPIATKKKLKPGKTYERRSFLEPKPSFVKGDKRVVSVTLHSSHLHLSMNISLNCLKTVFELIY